jgi:hypothetical protein
VGESLGPFDLKRVIPSLAQRRPQRSNARELRERPQGFAPQLRITDSPRTARGIRAREAAVESRREVSSVRSAALSRSSPKCAKALRRECVDVDQSRRIPPYAAVADVSGFDDEVPTISR